jgi:hypothetical protein
MTQNRYTLSEHFLQMKSEIELRGFSPQTMRHYLTHLRLLEKHLYSLLLRAASHTLMELAGDAKYLGATIGLTSVLHTWGRNLSFHPHVHAIVPGGRA